MALYNEQAYHYVMLAATFHPLAYLYKWNFPLQIGFKEKSAIIYSKQTPLLQET
jgi:hypothetical protein